MATASTRASTKTSIKAGTKTRAKKAKAPKKIKAVIAGATGLVGAALVHAICGQDAYGVPVTLTRRPHAPGKNHIVDFEHLETVAPLLRGDVLFLCLGTTRRRAGSLSAQWRVDYDYQYQLAQMARQNGVPHLCLVSSAGADAQARSPYLRMKGQLEDDIRKLGFQRLTIFQPSLLLGARDHRRWGEEIAALILPTLTRLPFLRAYRPIAGALVAAKMAQVAAQAGDGEAVYRLDHIFNL